jgi:hypothetical protein
MPSKHWLVVPHLHLPLDFAVIAVAQQRLGSDIVVQMPGRAMHCRASRWARPVVVYAAWMVVESSARMKTPSSPTRTNMKRLGAAATHLEFEQSLEDSCAAHFPDL